MIEKKAIYQCSICKNIVESLWNGNPAVKCCGKPMDKLEAVKQESGVEKHLPVIERNGNQVTISVGSTLHPMTEEHYILFVEIVAGNKVYRKDFVEGDTNPQAKFELEDEHFTVRAFCNLHGLWEQSF